MVPFGRRVTGKDEKKHGPITEAGIRISSRNAITHGLTAATVVLAAESCEEFDATRQGTLRQDVSRLTQSLAGELEGLIRREPAQWHLLQPNWPSDGDRTTAGPGEVP